MSKAIAVIKMPKGCMRCLCMYVSDYDGECHCAITRESVEEYGEGKVGSKPKWCPLKELPSSKDAIREEPHSVEDYRIGWNDCLKEILGDEYETN